MSAQETHHALESNLGHHGRSKSHYEQEVEVLERDLLDRRPSHHSGIHHHQRGQQHPTATIEAEHALNWAGQEESRGAHGRSLETGVASPCYSSERTVAAQAGEALEDVDKDKTDIVQVGPTDTPLDSWEEDGYLFTKEGRTVWVSTHCLFLAAVWRLIANIPGRVCSGFAQRSLPVPESAQVVHHHSRHLLHICHELEYGSVCRRRA